ncbi:formin-like protein 14 [Alnus glutinosa]|uniref:formin-like protein 14 n=1 Tax=Alnus glutinosa TaxID=3517 RepID=UPI002D76EAE2|nr:formin-like protein 14 [Alnus glutinosa]
MFVGHHHLHHLQDLHGQVQLCLLHHQFPGAPTPPSRGATPAPPPPPRAKGSNALPPPPPLVGKVKASSGPSSLGRGRGAGSTTLAPKKSSLKPLHWIKVTRAMQGSLWADSQKQENQSSAPEIDISELESLFSAASATDGSGTKGGGRRGSNMNKPEKVQLVDLRRAYNCEIMLSKIKIPLPDMITSMSKFFKVMSKLCHLLTTLHGLTVEHSANLDCVLA